MTINSTIINTFQVILPDNSKNLDEVLFPIHRQIEREYRSLPWPEKLQNIVVFTDVQGGRGDVAAAAKAIGVMQRICPTLNFDWVLWAAQLDQYDPRLFLNCEDPSKVGMRAVSLETVSWSEQLSCKNLFREKPFECPQFELSGISG